MGKPVITETQDGGVEDNGNNRSQDASGPTAEDLKNLEKKYGGIGSLGTPGRLKETAKAIMPRTPSPFRRKMEEELEGRFEQWKKSQTPTPPA